jgi:hypothetical protein
MLYLPGLKNIVADFYSCPSQAATGSVTAASAADPVDFEEMAPEQNRCPETQRLLGCTPLNWLSTRQVLNAWLQMFPQTIFAQLFPSNSEKNIFYHFHNVAHPGRLVSRRIFHLDLCGPVFPASSPLGPSSIYLSLIFSYLLYFSH